MSSAQDLRKRIKSVTNTQQITKAMKMVASARLRRAQQKAKGTEPYTERLRHMLHQSMSSLDGGADLPLLTVRPVNKVAYVVLILVISLNTCNPCSRIRQQMPMVYSQWVVSQRNISEAMAIL